MQRIERRHVGGALADGGPALSGPAWVGCGRRLSWLALMTVLALPVAAGDLGPMRFVEEAKLVAADGVEREVFADSVAISDRLLVVGAISDDDLGSRSGSGYIFELDAESVTWSQVAKVTAADGAAGDLFGDNCSVDGRTAVFGATQTFREGFNPGAVYVYESTALGPWVETAKLAAGDGDAGDGFGISVSISGDRIVVGASQDSDAGPGAGSAYLFERGADGIGWTEIAELEAPDSAAGANFGLSVDTSGQVAVVGAPLMDGTGAAYLFERDAGGPGEWGATAKLQPGDLAPGDLFGLAVGVDGDVVVVGAPIHGSPIPSTGAVYLFERQPTGEWVEVGERTAPDGAPGDLLGWSVEVDGETVVAGSWMDDAAGTDSGSAYLFQRGAGERGWAAVAQLVAADGAEGDIFGETVAVSGDLVAIGAALADDPGVDSGAAYIFRAVAELTVSGSCPGRVTVELDGVSPNATVALAAGDAGRSQLPAGPCTGSDLDLSDPAPLGTAVADGAGNAAIDLVAPSELCGKRLQAVDAVTCGVSEPSPIP